MAHDPALGHGSTEDWAWSVALAAAEVAEACALSGHSQSFAVGEAGLRSVSDSDRDAVITWRPHDGWAARLPDHHPGRPLFDLYLPVCSATKAHPVTVGHLGQSLDGFIATHTGDSQFVTGPENLKHMHRMRALCDAIIVGAGTVAADDPQLTTRHVVGSNPTRVIIDPTRRLSEHYRVFSDDAVETIVVYGRSLVQPDERTFGRATILALDDHDGTVDAAAILALLRARECHRIFVEGGGVTVSMFLEANLLDRLQMAIAPIIIGDGRPAIRLQQPPAALGDCHRPRYRVFRMGGDILFDCDLRATANDPSSSLPDGSILARVI
ncbi:MAG: RibD family protein [Acidimicrobiia bacterium]|nr:RibD family protein [Acidimicrobiia bacterium]